MANVTRRCHVIAGQVRKVWGDKAVEAAPTDRGTDWVYRFTAPDRFRIQLHRTPSSVGWEKSFWKAMDEHGWTADKEAAEQRAKDERAARLKQDREKNELATREAADRAKRHADAIAAAAGPLGHVGEFDVQWLLTPHEFPETRTGIVTPAIAEKILDTINVKNRKIVQGVLDGYIASIENDEWGYTHQGWAIDWDGVLQDGQHRAEAIKRTGKPQKVMITVGMDPANFKKVDVGRNRTARDAAYMRGESNLYTLTPAARLLYVIDRFGPDTHLKGPKTRVSVYAVDSFLEGLGDQIRDAVKRSLAIRREIKINTPGLAAAIYAITMRLPEGDPRVAAFLDDLEGGVHIDKTDPVWALRRLFIRHADYGGRRSLNAYETFAYVIKAWNMRAKNQTMRPGSALRWANNEAFPAQPFLPPPIDADVAA